MRYIINILALLTILIVFITNVSGDDVGLSTSFLQDAHYMPAEWNGGNIASIGLIMLVIAIMIGGFMLILGGGQ